VTRAPTQSAEVAGAESGKVHHLARREPVRFCGFAEKGFVGWCEYSVSCDAPARVARALQLLASAGGLL
jgi:hypothetical protein